MRTKLLRDKHFSAPVFLLVLMLKIAASGSDPTAAPAASQAGSDVVPATFQAEDAQAKEAEMVESEKIEAEANAMEGGKMEARKMAPEAMMDSGVSLKVELTGVEPLVNGYHYEGWVIIGGNPVSTGKFNIGPDGDLIALDGMAMAAGVFHSIRWKVQRM